jgi:hypothetical protein
MRTTIVILLALFSAASLLSHVAFDDDYFCGYARAKTVYYGTIQFPMNLHHIPDIRIYYKGYRISCETNNETKRATFSIVDENHRSDFKLLFTEHLQFETTEQNVVEYLKVPDYATYKFFSLNLIKTNPFLEETEEGSSNGHKTTWKVRELRKALHNGIIPDDTIIVCMDPNYIEKINGGNTTTLPSFKIRHDLVKFVGSEEKIQQKADELLLSMVMDCDAIHATLQQEIHPKYERNMIVALTT